MLYYSQGKGDTNEKVKTLRHEDFKIKNQEKRNRKVLTDSLKGNENN